jgi:hypothetical protein
MHADCIFHNYLPTKPQSNNSKTKTLAAVLCNSIGKVFSGTCDAVGKVLTLPCKACGFACDGLSQAMKSPFCLYLTVAVGLNIPPVIFAGQGFASGGGGGCSVALTWLSINAVLCIANIAAAFYISGKVVHDPNDIDDDANEAPYIKATVGGNKDPTPPTKLPSIFENRAKTMSRFSRVREVLCYDPIVAVYILVGIFYVIWQSMGFGRMNEAANCGGGMEDFISRSLMCGFLFISLGATAFGCSVCCLR